MYTADRPIDIQEPVSSTEGSPPLRILFMTDAFLPHAGGARVYYNSLYRELTRQGQARVTVLTRKVPGWRDYDRVESTEEYRIIRCGYPLPSWKYHHLPKIAVPLARAAFLMATQKFDLIHFGDLYPQGALSLWFKRTLRMPYIAYSHGEEITSTDRRKYWPKFRNAIFGGADAVVAANEFARQNLLRIGMPEERIKKITPGVDCLRFRPEPSREDLIRRHELQGKKVLLTVARLVPRKGHRTVLEALRKLLPQISNLVYLIAGTGPEEEKLRQIVTEWGLTNAVRFVGFVKDGDLPAYYNAADLYVMPNSEDGGDIEGFGMVFLEANACGKAVVGGRSGGAAEAVVDGKTGMLVDPHNPQELADVIRMLLQNETARTNMGEFGRMRAEFDFSWASRARSLHRVNRTVISGSKAASHAGIGHPTF